MNPGRLNKRVNIIYYENSRNEYGEPTKERKVLRTVWAAISPLLGRNYFAAQQVQTEATTKINTRYFSDIKRNMFIEYGDITYEIIDIQDVNMRHEELVIYCKEVTTE
jgi:SPP1 family predicted phage head-tail adaptor